MKKVNTPLYFGGVHSLTMFASWDVVFKKLADTMKNNIQVKSEKDCCVSVSAAIIYDVEEEPLSPK